MKALREISILTDVCYLYCALSSKIELYITKFACGLFFCWTCLRFFLVCCFVLVVVFFFPVSLLNKRKLNVLLDVDVFPHNLLLIVIAVMGFLLIYTSVLKKSIYALNC